jgi:4-carboxymuconolactone decarboxylase
MRKTFGMTGPGAAISVVLALSVPAARGEDAVRFAPLKAEELSPPQKAWPT